MSSGNFHLQPCQDHIFWSLPTTTSSPSTCDSLEYPLSSSWQLALSRLRRHGALMTAVSPSAARRLLVRLPRRSELNPAAHLLRPHVGPIADRCAQIRPQIPPRDPNRPQRSRYPHSQPDGQGQRQGEAASPGLPATEGRQWTGGPLPIECQGQRQGEGPDRAFYLSRAR